MGELAKVWVLTRELNQYDQDGQYFVAVFGVKPTHQQLRDHKVPINRIRHVLNGGGRKDWEDEWFILTDYDVVIEQEAKL